MAPGRAHSASWEVDAHLPKPRGESRARRSHRTKELVLRPAPNVNTVHDILLYAARTYTSKEGFGWRDVLDVQTEEQTITRSSSSTSGSTRPSLKRTVETYKLSPFKWISYQDALQEVRDLGCGLRALGAGARTKGQYFGMYASTSRNWMFMAQACAFNGVPICTVYDSAALAAVSEAFNEASVPAVYTDADLLPNVERLIERTPTLRLIVYDGEPDKTTLSLLAQHERVKTISINDVKLLGQAHYNGQAQRATRDDVYCLMYTSGGGGKPKGVLLTHGNVCSAVGSSHVLLGDLMHKETSFLAFLPQAHIFEFVVEMSFIFMGLPIAYGRIKTLTDLGVRGCKNDIMEARPSVMVAVPTVWELMRKGIIQKVESTGGIKKAMFNAAVRAKTGAPRSSVIGGLTDAMVFKRVRASTGGRLRTIISGGGPIARETQQFLSAALVQMVQGYGLTEGTALACVLHPDFHNVGAVGGPVPSVEIKLVDRPEVGPGYYAHNDPPTGEVHIRGPSVFKGYFNSEFDAEAFTQDGWLRTGDIGQWNPDGTLTIIDRIKNHVRLANGFILIEKLESVYKSCPLILNACIVANAERRAPALIAIAHPSNLPSFLRKNGIQVSSSTLDMHILDQKVINLVLNELNTCARKAGLKGHQLLDGLVLTCDNWTPESGLLTAAQKLRRPLIEEHYADAIERIQSYDSIQKPPMEVAQFKAGTLRSRSARNLV